MRALVLLAAALCLQAADKAPDDLMLQAMRDELDRSRTLRVTSLDPPYYIEYVVNELTSFNASASLGALVQSGGNRFRIQNVSVRVGSYDFDNTNYLYSDYYSGSRYDSEQLPIDDDYGNLRRAFWLATDRVYKGAAEAIGRKRAALKNMTQTDQLPDRWKADPVDIVRPSPRITINDKLWTDRVRKLSGLLLEYPELRDSSVTFGGNVAQRYMVNSEGTRIRVPESLSTINIRAMAIAADGSAVRDAIALHAESPEGLPAEAALIHLVKQTGANVQALAAAPVGEAYVGPILFEGTAGAQILAELIGSDLGLTRKPVSEPGRPAPVRTSELESRVGSKILPEFLDVVDDPTRTEYNGIRLYGDYLVDEEGVVPKPLKIVEKGKLTTLLTTRQPVKGFTESNGRARLPGAFGARTPAYSNLIVTASVTVPSAELKKKLLEMAASRQKPYAIIIRKMDFPSSASLEEIRRIAINSQQSGGSGKPLSVPLLAYRVYPDGREELVRGMQFRGVTLRSLRDIVAVSGESYVFQYLNNMAPFALMGAGGYVAPSAVAAPSLLFEELELARPQEDRPNAPLVPAPTIAVLK